MAVHLTRIYTRTGDDGSTALGDLTRVPKTSPRVGAYADVDEANAAIGAAISLGALEPGLADRLLIVQNDLFDAGADLCTPIRENPKWPPLRLPDAAVTRLESWCDELNEPLGKLSSFVLPGGTAGAALLHQARTVARRAERSVWALLEAEPEATSPVPARYLNRLSDLLFVMARTANAPASGGPGDLLWRPAGERSRR